jgi:hypothetical protein
MTGIETAQTFAQPLLDSLIGATEHREDQSPSATA